MDGEEICKCDKSFATNRTLNSHIASFHEGRASDGSEIKLKGNKIGKEKAVLNIHTSVVYPKETKDFKTEIVKENLLKMED